jgi:hypothetical protein
MDFMLQKLADAGSHKTEKRTTPLGHSNITSLQLFQSIQPPAIVSAGFYLFYFID